MAKNTRILTDIAFKKLSNVSITNPGNSEFQEKIKTNVQLGTNTIFSSLPPNTPPGDLWDVDGGQIVQYVELDLVAIADGNYKASDYGTTGTNQVGADDLYDDVGGTGEGSSPTVLTDHAYAAKLPSNYESTGSAFTKKGAGYFTNNTYLSGSNGGLQLVPPSYGSTYAAVAIIDENDNVLDPGTNFQDFYVDFYSGVVFRQDGDASPYPAKLRAYLYIGAFASESIGNAGDTVDLHISASDGNGFSIANAATASFSSGSAGISVTAGATNKITIGASTDNVTFNQITASIINVDKIEASEYIVSSSITYFTQSFSSGSTIFGDTNDDTHQFTGSIQILHTGSTYGFQMSGSNFLIDYGNSGSITLGEYNVGKELGGLLGPITGSGLIISSAFSNQATHHNMVKIGETELVDISGSQYGLDAFLINVKEKALVISSSELDKPVAQFEAGNTTLYGNTTGRALFEIDTDDVTLGDPSVGSDTYIDGNTIVLRSADLRARVVNGTPGASSHLIFSVENPNDNSSTLTNDAQLKSIPLTSSFTYLGGPVTASAVSSSGLLYASASDDGGTITTIAVAMYDTASGRFYYTASNSIQGDTTTIEADITELQASASAGIQFRTGSHTVGTSIALMGTASFAASGDGLSVDEDSGTITYTIGGGILSSSYQIEADISGAIDAATGSLLTTYTFLSSSQQIATDISGAIDAATGSLSASILGTANEVEVTSTGLGNITIGLPNDVTIGNNLTVTNDLIVQGTTTSINTSQLNVEDPFILLNSASSDPNSDGGIIVQTDDSANGTALFYDNSNNRWAIAESSSVAWNVGNDTAVAHQYVVSVSQSATAPTGNPSNFGLADASWYGMMYVDTSDTTDGGLYIYLP